MFEDEEMENEIQLNEIDTECPRRTTCVERFFCDKFSGKNVFDQIVRKLISYSIIITTFFSHVY